MRTTVLGTGLMGAGIAASLLRAGHEVTVWNRTPGRAQPLVAAGARWAPTPAAAVADAEVVLIVVFDAASVLEVLAGAGGAASPETVWVQTATIGAAGTAAVAEVAQRAGLRLVETMMMGSKTQAEEGNLILLGGGDPAWFAQAEPVLQAISRRRVDAGDHLGAGTALKLACNAWIGTITAGIAQSIALLESQGLDPLLFAEAMSGGTSDTPYIHMKSDKIARGDYSPQFAVDALRKDLDLIRAVAAPGQVSTALLDTLRELYAAAAHDGRAHEDIATVLHEFRGAATRPTKEQQ